MSAGVSNTRAGGGLHATLADEVLEHNCGDEFIRAQDGVAPFSLAHRKNKKCIMRMAVQRAREKVRQKY